MHLTSHHIRCLKRDLLDDGVADSSDHADTKVQWTTRTPARILRVGMFTSTQEVWAALAWGTVSSAGLLIGAIVGSFFRMSHHAIARAMSVGAGLLLAGVSFKVAADAVKIAGPVAAALSLLLGAALFSLSNALLARFGAGHRKRCGDCVQQPSESQQPGSGVAIAFGNALDGLPEALVRESRCVTGLSRLRWSSRSRWAIFPKLCRAQRGCGPPAAATRTSF